MPRAKIQEKEKARMMREEGLSIRKISDKLNVSKSSVSYWCRDIQLSAKQIKVLSENQRNRAIEFGEKKRRERIRKTEKIMRRGMEEVGKLSKRDLFMVGLALYWGEGYKKGSQEMALTNSDKNIIIFFIEWLRQIYNVPKEDLILRVSVNESHVNRERDILRYWVDATGVSEKQFTKTSFIKTKTKKVYKNKSNHHGTLRVKVRRGTNLRRKVLGSIQALNLS